MLSNCTYVAAPVPKIYLHRYGGGGNENYTKDNNVLLLLDKESGGEWRAGQAERFQPEGGPCPG